MELILVRHAESIWNAEERWQGQSDIPLSTRGEEEALRLAARCADLEVDAVIASDLMRAKETAAAVVRARGKGALVTHEGLREMNLGAWCGLPHAEVVSRFPDELAALAQGDDRRIGGDGESLPIFSARVHQALHEVCETHRGAKRLMIVMHGGCIRSVLFAMLGLKGRMRPLEGARNTSLTTLIDAVPGVSLGRLKTYNDTLHVGPEEGEPLLGEEGKARLITLLDLAADAPLVTPPSAARTALDAKSRRLVTYAIGA
jgi:broad specificity phosphatase PhoE